MGQSSSSAKRASNHERCRQYVVLQPTCVFLLLDSHMQCNVLSFSDLRDCIARIGRINRHFHRLSRSTAAHRGRTVVVNEDTAALCSVGVISALKLISGLRYDRPIFKIHIDRVRPYRNAQARKQAFRESCARRQVVPKRVVLALLQSCEHLTELSLSATFLNGLSRNELTGIFTALTALSKLRITSETAFRSKINDEVLEIICSARHSSLKEVDFSQTSVQLIDFVVERSLSCLLSSNSPLTCLRLPQSEGDHHHQRSIGDEQVANDACENIMKLLSTNRALRLRTLSTTSAMSGRGLLSLIGPRLESVTEFDMSGTIGVSLASLSQLPSLPYLTALSLPPIIFAPDDRNDPNDQRTFHFLPAYRATLSQLEPFQRWTSSMLADCRALRSLRVHPSLITLDDVQMLEPLRFCSQLRSFTFVKKISISLQPSFSSHHIEVQLNACLCRLLRKPHLWPNLHSLHLGGLMFPNPNTVAIICCTLPQLVAITLETTSFDINGLDPLSSLRNLRILTIIGIMFARNISRSFLRLLCIPCFIVGVGTQDILPSNPQRFPSLIAFKCSIHNVTEPAPFTNKSFYKLFQSQLIRHFQCNLQPLPGALLSFHDESFHIFIFQLIEMIQNFPNLSRLCPINNKIYDFLKFIPSHLFYIEYNNSNKLNPTESNSLLYCQPDNVDINLLLRQCIGDDDFICCYPDEERRNALITCFRQFLKTTKIKNDESI